MFNVRAVARIRPATDRCPVTERTSSGCNRRMVELRSMQHPCCRQRGVVTRYACLPRNAATRNQNVVRRVRGAELSSRLRACRLYAMQCPCRVSTRARRTQPNADR